MFHFRVKEDLKFNIAFKFKIYTECFNYPTWHMGWLPFRNKISSMFSKVSSYIFDCCDWSLAIMVSFSSFLMKVFSYQRKVYIITTYISKMWVIQLYVSQPIIFIEKYKSSSSFYTNQRNSWSVSSISKTEWPFFPGHSQGIETGWLHVC